MRIHLSIKAKGITIPYNHQHLLVGAIHKWIGENEAHGSLSLYSFSWLQGGKAGKNGLFFKESSNFFISAWDNTIIKRLIAGIQQDNSMFEGLEVAEICIQEDPDVSNKEFFLLASPVFIKRTISDRQKHYLYSDQESDTLLKETLMHKMTLAGLEDAGLEIGFDRSYHRKKTQKITYKDIENRCSYCPVIIKGKPETKAFAWNVGIGNSTGIGFGAIK